MISLELQDCQVNEKTFHNPTQVILRIRACDNLNSAFLSNELEIISLTNSRYSADIEDPIKYTLDNKDQNKATFTTSRYVGFFEKNNVSITIIPRFGNKVRNHLIANALELYLPKGESGKESSSSKNLWLIALLWRANVEKALTKSQIPKVYKKIEKNQNFFKGRLNIAKQIKYNTVDQSKFYCIYSKFSLDNTINRTIRYCYRLLLKDGYREILQGFSEHDETLNDFGVPNNPVSVQEINSIVYSPMIKYYKPLMELSKSIINFKAYQNTPNLSNKSGFSVFLDMAEIWENYLYNLIRKNLDECEVENPNLTGDYSLFLDGSRKVRPDIIIRKKERIIAIIDAKYKNYTKIGNYSNEPSAVSREDLYQMTTYLHRFGDENCIGLFITPFEASEEPKELTDTKQKIGVLGLDLNKNITDSEEDFINRLKNIIGTIA